LALHASLKAELALSRDPGARLIRTVLVAPGQVGTALFARVRTPSNFLAPVVEPTVLAREIVRVLDAGESGEVRVPLYAAWVPAMAGLPVGVQAVVRRWSGMDRATVEARRE
jgi:hypothetical protein